MWTEQSQPSGQLELRAWGLDCGVLDLYHKANPWRMLLSDTTTRVKWGIDPWGGNLPHKPAPELHS